MLQQAAHKLRCLSSLRGLLASPVLGSFAHLLQVSTQDSWVDILVAHTDFLYALQQSKQPSLGAWLAQALYSQENPYATALVEGAVTPMLESSARYDVAILQEVAQLDCGLLVQRLIDLLPADQEELLDRLPRWEIASVPSFDQLTATYATQGAGLFAVHKAFLWVDGQLIPVEHPDIPQTEEMLGYEDQRAELLANTRALVEGKQVNDALLFGDSGTGKSATVKYLLSQPELSSLRLIEVQKEGLRDMPALIRRLRGLPQKFILFIDDLAFDQDDTTYSVMKTILEGGLECRPQNVAIYATSNRRLLVRQTFSDRTGDDVDRQETISEKTALSDRFGLRICYMELNKAQFLRLIQQMAEQEGVSLPAQELNRLAVRWDMRNPNRSPRGAKQFIASLVMGDHDL